MALPVEKRIAAVTVPGDRRDEDIRVAGRLCAAFDYVILREDADLRGRDPGATAALMREGLLAAGFPEERMTFIPGEAEALRRGIAMLSDNDLMVVLADKVPSTLRSVQELITATDGPGGGTAGPA